MTRKGKWIAGALVVTVLTAWARFMFCVFVGLFIGTRQAEFDSARWKAGWTIRCTPIRQQMAGDLVENYELEGRTRKEILELLGEADSTPRYQPGEFTYKLGPHPMIDDYWLAIDFDENGRVSRAAVVMD